MPKPKSSQTDELTGLINRVTFQVTFPAKLDRTKEAHAHLSLALLDIDEFLSVNKNYGHLAGDRVIQGVAVVINEKIGQKGLACRFGGDEFAMLFPGLEREQAFLILEQIREGVEAYPFTTDDGKAIPGIRVSGGLASFPVDGRSETELLRKADQALYRAKLTGRNKIRLAYEEKMVPKTSHFTQTQLERLTKLAEELGTGEAELLREALDMLLVKYGINDIET